MTRGRACAPTLRRTCNWSRPPAPASSPGHVIRARPRPVVPSPRPYSAFAHGRVIACSVCVFVPLRLVKLSAPCPVPLSSVCVCLSHSVWSSYPRHAPPRCAGQKPKSQKSQKKAKKPKKKHTDSGSRNPALKKYFKLFGDEGPPGVAHIWCSTQLWCSCTTSAPHTHVERWSAAWDAGLLEPC